MRVLISGGGTGGHVYPALAVAPHLSHPAATPQAAATPAAVRAAPAAPNAPDDLLWVGSANGMELPLVERAGIAYAGIATGQLRGKDPLTAIRNSGKMVAGMQQSRLILDRFRADVCFVTGGYVCAPVVLACRTRRIPVLIYLPDMTPGAAIRWLSHLAQRVAVSFAGAAQYFGGLAPAGKAVVTGYPVRDELLAAVAAGRPHARRTLAAALDRPLDTGPAADLPLLLVWGGSQGSRTINQATWGALPSLLAHAHVLHVIGQRDWQMAQPTLAALPNQPGWQPDFAERYHPVDYLHETMPWALAAADLTVARAGASTLGEFPVANLPSVLVPLPIAGVNQRRNAEVLAAQGAALVMEDEALPSQLGPAVTELLQNRARLAAMAAAAGSLATPDAAANIAHELVRLGQVYRR
jgi:UDP-N-acetylglucosamine--N-acetylmuramyl-(pentapeptide) pyrophosphoryl-undecaprenol N-acetylglucosamine transferase